MYFLSCGLFGIIFVALKGFIVSLIPNKFHCRFYHELSMVRSLRYTPCFISPSGISEVCGSEIDLPTGGESVSMKRVNNQVFFLCLVMWLSYLFLH
jgi:hypothetical protein